MWEETASESACPSPLIRHARHTNTHFHYPPYKTHSNVSSKNYRPIWSWSRICILKNNTWGRQLPSRLLLTLSLRAQGSRPRWTLEPKCPRGPIYGAVKKTRRSGALLLANSRSCPSALEICTGIHRAKLSPGSPGRPPGYPFGTG